MPELKQHQIEGVARIKAQGSLLLGDEPGVGKTAQMIMASKDDNKILILTLASLKFQMRDEIEKWFTTSVTLIDGNARERQALWGRDTQYYIANYELLLRDLPYMAKIPWDWIVCDEATRLSNIKNKQYKALRKLKATHRLPMTGTPVSNRPDDLWGLLDWAIPGCLGSWYFFMLTYIVRNPQRWIVGYKNLETLQKKIQPLMLRRTKEQVLDLPEIIYSNVPFQLGPKERKLYEQIKMGLLLDIEKTEISKIDFKNALDLAIVKFGKLCELCDSMELLGEGTDSAKLDALRAVLETLNGSKTIIFTRFSRMADIIQRELKCLKITGDVNLVNRQAVLAHYAMPSGISSMAPNNDVLVMTNAGEYGLNIQTANAIIHFEQPLSIARKEQREGRAHRMGQDKHVLVYNLVAEKTVDQAMMKKLLKKQDMSRLLLSDIKELVA